MTDQSSPKLLGDDEAASIAEALLGSRAPTVSVLADSFESDEERRTDDDLVESVRNSVFGRPEPLHRGTHSFTPESVLPAQLAPSTGRPSPLTTPAARSVIRPRESTSGAPSVATMTRAAADEDDRRKKVTLVLASLFAVALVASISVTAFGLGFAEADPEGSDPTVQGTTQTTAPEPAQTTLPAPPTTPEPTTTEAPATTAAPVTEAPTTEAPTTDAPTTTAAPTTAAPPTTPPTTRQPTTTRPATTRPPTTRPPTTVTTQPTLPDITFAPPTWVPTDAPPDDTPDDAPDEPVAP